MRIGELARRSGLSTSRIRFYERHGLIPAAARDGNGYRDHPATVVAILRFIGQAQALGFTLAEIQTGLGPHGEVAMSSELILSALENKMRAVEVHIAEAQSRKDRIVATMRKYARLIKEENGQASDTTSI